MTNRYRCSGCGNLTRFDVVVTRRTRAFHHFIPSSLGAGCQSESLGLPFGVAE